MAFCTTHIRGVLCSFVFLSKELLDQVGKNDTFVDFHSKNLEDDLDDV